jgi:murein DD-endopeptidase MepM/ murein hydrolase activator NlpD
VRAEPGDTLASIAATHGQTIDQVAALNRLTPSDRLFPGQPLLLPRNAVAADPLRFGAVQAVRLPDRLIQGRTGTVVVTTTRPLELEGNWNGLPLSFVPLRDNGLAQFAYLPVPALIAPSSYWVTLSYTASNGLRLNQTWPVPVAEGPYESQEINLPPDRGVLLAPEIVQTELERVSEVWSVRTPALAWTQPFTHPISAEYPTSSPFGTRRSYNGGPYASYHEGQDFASPEGIPVLAPGDGVVALADALNVRGNAVIIDHGGGVFSGYWHLSELRVTPGQTVRTGDVLGISGNTGLSTGAHLHWELRIYGIAVDPLQFTQEPLAPPL